MPIYEYQCEHCAHKMEAIQKINDTPLSVCPECQREALRRLVSAAAFKLTGTGWYETDFKHSKKDNEQSAKDKDAKGDQAEDGSQSKEEKPKDETPKDEQPQVETPKTETPEKKNR